MASPSTVGSSIFRRIFCITVTGIDALDSPLASVAGRVFVPSYSKSSFISYALASVSGAVAMLMVMVLLSPLASLSIYSVLEPSAGVSLPVSALLVMVTSMLFVSSSFEVLRTVKVSVNVSPAYIFSSEKL